MKMARVAWLMVVLAPVLSQAQALNAVTVGDLPNTGGRWQQGEVTLVAPAAEVQRWLTDASRWQERFPDDSAVRDHGRTPDGRHVVSFHSEALGRTLTVRMREERGLITYDGGGKNVSTQGKIYVQPLGPDRTRVIMQTTGELHGLIGVVAPEKTKRERAIKKLSADLHALVRLSNAWAAASRRGG